MWRILDPDQELRTVLSDKVAAAILNAVYDVFMDGTQDIVNEMPLASWGSFPADASAIVSGDHGPPFEVDGAAGTNLAVWAPPATVILRPAARP